MAAGHGPARAGGRALRRHGRSGRSTISTASTPSSPSSAPARASRPTRPSRIMRTASPGSTISSGWPTARSPGWSRGWRPAWCSRSWSWPTSSSSSTRCSPKGVEGSSFYRPVANFPAEVPEAERPRLRAAYAAVDLDQDQAGGDPASRLHPRPLSAAGAPDRRASGHEGRTGPLPPPGGAEHHHRHDARTRSTGSASPRWPGSTRRWRR